MSKRMAWVLGGLIVLGAAVRLRALSNDLWLDEVWSWFFALRIRSPLEILGPGATDNSHPLNTLYLWFLSDQTGWTKARWLSYAAGLATLLLLAWLGRRWSEEASVFATLLGACSFLLVVFGSEARGYALAMFFGLACFALAPGSPVGPWRAPLFWTVILCGFLSHASFFFVYLGSLASAFHGFLSVEGSRRRLVKGFVLMHGIPMVLAGMFLAWYRSLAILGAPPRDAVQLLVDLGRFAFGFPDLPPVALGGMALLLVAGLQETWVMAKEKRAEWPFFLVSIYLAPPVAFVLSKQQMWYPRYVVVCLPLLCLLLARRAERLWRGPFLKRLAVGLLALLFLGGNAIHFGDFLRDGRGRYTAAIRRMADETAGTAVTVGGDQDNRIEPMIIFYARSVSGGKQFQYRREALMRPGVEVEWYVDHSSESAGRPAPSIVLPNGGRYLLVEAFPFVGPSGHTWYLYRRN